MSEAAPAIVPLPAGVGGDGSARDSLRRGQELYRTAAEVATADYPAGARTRTATLRERMGSSRVFLLYVARNDHVQQERRLTIRAGSMEELVASVRAEMELPEEWDFVLCTTAGSSVSGRPNPTPYEDFAAVTTRAVVQLWPRQMFGADKGESQDCDLEARLYRAAVHGDEETLGQLLALLPCPLVASSGEPPAVGGNSALHAAAYYGSTGCLARFLEVWGEDLALTIQNEHGQTALHCAARGGQDQACRLLLDAGSDCIALDSDDHTPRDIAVRDGHKAVSGLLERPEIEGKALVFGLLADEVLGPKLLIAEQRIESMRDQMAQSERAWGARLATQEQEWRTRLEEQQIRRMEAMEQLRVDYEKQAAAQMHEAFENFSGATAGKSNQGGSWGS
jgi:hypothetical protein